MRAAYLGEVAYVDDQIERLLAAVADSGVLDDTLIVVTSDHGEGLMEHGEPTHGVFLYEGVARVPLILRFPRGLPAGGRVESVVGLIDVMPTILEGLGLATDPAIDGRSRWGLASGGGDDVAAGQAYLESRYPLLEYGWAPLRAVRTPEWKYVDAPEAELYALRDDPGERVNVIAANREVAARLHAGLDDAFREARDGEPQEIAEDELERLRSLGYLQGVDTRSEDGPVGADPKSKIAQYIELRLTAGEMMEGRYAQAEKRLEALVESDPGNVAVHCRLADARMGLRDWNGAESALHDALEVAQGRGRAAVVWRLAAVERGRGNHQRALDYYREHAEIAPLSVRTVQRMAETLRDARRDDEAEAVLRDWLGDHPSSLVALRDLARLLDDDGRHDEAGLLWRRVLGIRPQDEEARSALEP
jgi:tetratricopeptide (TPR) repeat protein